MITTVVGGGMPGHWRNATAIYRWVAYIIVAIAMASFTAMLFSVWDDVTNYDKIAQGIDSHINN